MRHISSSCAGKRRPLPSLSAASAARRSVVRASANSRAPPPPRAAAAAARSAAATAAAAAAAAALHRGRPLHRGRLVVRRAGRVVVVLLEERRTRAAAAAAEAAERRFGRGGREVDGGLVGGRRREVAADELGLRLHADVEREVLVARLQRARELHVVDDRRARLRHRRVLCHKLLELAPGQPADARVEVEVVDLDGAVERDVAPAAAVLREERVEQRIVPLLHALGAERRGGRGAPRARRVVGRDRGPLREELLAVAVVGAVRRHGGCAEPRQS